MHETCFFREMPHFDHLRAVLKERGPIEAPFRVWSAACSTGEEPYSIAMVLADLLPPRRWEVFASDVSARVLDTARRGQYPMARAAHMPEAYLHRFCMTGIDSTMSIARTVRECVDFARVNLSGMHMPQIGKFDGIFLRNVLDYFDAGARLIVAQRLVGYLRPGGHLYVGHSESLHDMQLPLQGIAPAIYRKETG